MILSIKVQISARLFNHYLIEKEETPQFDFHFFSITTDFNTWPLL
jgi:hypothetical protein